MSNTTNRYISTESLHFVIETKAEDSTKAYLNHLELIGIIVDVARQRGIKLEECFDNDSGVKIVRIDEDGNEHDAVGWINGEKD